MDVFNLEVWSTLERHRIVFHLKTAPESRFEASGRWSGISGSAGANGAWRLLFSLLFFFGGDFQVGGVASRWSRLSPFVWRAIHLPWWTDLFPEIMRLPLRSVFCRRRWRPSCSIPHNVNVYIDQRGSRRASWNRWPLLRIKKRNHKSIKWTRRFTLRVTRGNR